MKNNNIKNQKVIELITQRNYGEVVNFQDLANILEYNLDDEKEKKEFFS